MARPDMKDLARIAFTLSTAVACTSPDTGPRPQSSGVAEKMPSAPKIPTSPSLISSERQWSPGPVCEIGQILILNKEGTVRTITVFGPPDRTIEAGSQLTELTTFFLNWKKEPTTLPSSLQIIFTDSEPPKEIRGWGVTDENTAKIFLGKIEKKPFDPRLPFATQVNIIFVAEFCSLLLNKTDFPQDFQNIEKGLICDSIGWSAGAALRNLSYEEYYRESKHAYYDGTTPVLSVDEEIYTRMQEIVGGKPPITIK
jgi:hypothetical protein